MNHYQCAVFSNVFKYHWFKLFVKPLCVFDTSDLFHASTFNMDLNCLACLTIALDWVAKIYKFNVSFESLYCHINLQDELYHYTFTLAMELAFQYVRYCITDVCTFALLDQFLLFLYLKDPLVLSHHLK